MPKKAWYVVIRKDLDNMGPKVWDIQVVYCYEPATSGTVWVKASGPFPTEQEAEQSLDKAIDTWLAQEVT